MVRWRRKGARTAATQFVFVAAAACFAAAAAAAAAAVLVVVFVVVVRVRRTPTPSHKQPTPVSDARQPARKPVVRGRARAHGGPIGCAPLQHTHLKLVALHRIRGDGHSAAPRRRARDRALAR